MDHLFFFKVLISEVYTILSWTPNLRFQTLDPVPYGNSAFFVFRSEYPLGIIGAGKAVNKSAARAASLDSVKFQAVIESA